MSEAEHQELQRVVGDPPAAAISYYSSSMVIDAPDMGSPGKDSTAESERVTKRYFGLFGQGDTAGMLALLHPEVEWVLKSTRPGEILRGKRGVEVFLDEIAGKFYDLVTEVYRPLDHEHVIVEGRLRWTDDERVLRDDPVIWALVFRDGLLWRSTPAQSVAEAESMLAHRAIAQD